MQIISASRRTDIPAFYGEWFMNRIREGYFIFKNPYNAKQMSKISLRPEDVTAIVFWTKNPAPFMKYLDELQDRGYRFYFQYTLNGYGPEMEPFLPSVEKRIKTFKKLSEKIGKEKVIWRYDPVIFSNVHSSDYHREKFSYILNELKDFTTRVVISFVDEYRKATINFKKLKEEGIEIYQPPEVIIKSFAYFMAEEAKKLGLEIQSCAENIAYLPAAGIMPGKCIDADYIEKVFSLTLPEKLHLKDKSQRQECGCVVSKDVGVYDTCLHGCKYCYAGSYEAGKKNYEKHDPNSPLLIGKYDGGEAEPTLF
ncbi:DUF1848 domain-containing protein [Carboxydothermus hydrogenoformans]|uniref:DUF1848 domain-containing protein n=1 Tax=Carboxydothermus hydrogenoformans (strain ATCC BAA-161 / DSM 6008 / Z-2901) TaxID=246194 RepID=Q3AA92_CARHZ|nr:DUF1848 domain-containing protein [Carboxydothermus hydrogenoformans]ABB15939.1 conserved hypothetical protein [Carboxydothermus hydrogenoformans Z-2901]